MWSGSWSQRCSPSGVKSMLLLLLLHLGACWVHRLAAHDSSQGLGHAPAVRPLVVNFEIGRPRELFVDMT